MKGGIIGGICFLTYLISLTISVQAESDPIEIVDPVSVDAFINTDNKLVLSLAQIQKLKAAQTSIEESAEQSKENIDGNTDTKKYRRSGRPDTEEEIEGLGVDRGLKRAQAVREFAYPYQIYGYQHLIQCNSQGEMYYLNIFGGCHICVCVVEFSNLVPKCARCDDECGIPEPEPTPPPTPEPKSGCHPFEENVPFENPLNPCQLCLCTLKPFAQPGEVQVACIENPKCIIVSTTTELPTTTWTPFPPSTEVTILPTPTTTIRPLLTILPAPTTTLRPPHVNCAPFTHNVPYTNPEDDCEICVCMEYKNKWATEVQTTCKTKPECCLVPNPDPEVTYLSPICRYHTLNEVFVVPGFMCKQFVCRMENRHIFLETQHNPQCDNSNLIIPDTICKSRTFGEEFIHPNDRCRACHCEIFGSVVAPICKKQIGCGELVPTISANIMIFIAPFCKYQPPNVDVVNGCNVCQCSSVYSFVVSNCRPRGQCDAQQPDSGEVINNSFIDNFSKGLNNGFGVDTSQSLANNQDYQTLLSSDNFSQGLNNGFGVDTSQSLANNQYYQTLLSSGQLIGTNSMGSADINGQLGNYGYNNNNGYPNVKESSAKYIVDKGNNNNGYSNVKESSAKYIVDNGNNNNGYPNNNKGYTNVKESSAKYIVDNGNINNGYPNVKESSVKYIVDNGNNNNGYLNNNNGYPNVKESSVKYIVDNGNNKNGFGFGLNNGNNDIEGYPNVKGSSIKYTVDQNGYPNVRESSIKYNLNGNNNNNNGYPDIQESSKKYTLDYGNNNNQYIVGVPNSNNYHGGVDPINGGWNYNTNKYPIGSGPQVEQIIELNNSESEDNEDNVEALEKLFGVDDKNFVNVQPIDISKAKIKSGRPERSALL